MNSTKHSLDKAEEILREGGADTEAVARAMVEGLRALDESSRAELALIASSQKSTGRTGVILASAGAVIVALAIATGLLLSEIRNSARNQSESLSAAHAALLEKHAALIRDVERSGAAAAAAATKATDAAARSERAADDIERSTKEIARQVTIMTERAKQTEPAR